MTVNPNSLIVGTLLVFAIGCVLLFGNFTVPLIGYALLGGLVILVGEIIYRNWLPSQIVRWIFCIFGALLGAPAFTGLLQPYLPQIMTQSPTGWLIVVLAATHLGVTAYGGWKAYKLGDGKAAAAFTILQIKLILVLGFLYLVLQHERFITLMQWGQDRVQQVADWWVSDVSPTATLLRIGLILGAALLLMPLFRGQKVATTSSGSDKTKTSPGGGWLRNLLLVGLILGCLYFLTQPETLDWLKRQGGFESFSELLGPRVLSLLPLVLAIVATLVVARLLGRFWLNLLMGVMVFLLVLYFLFPDLWSEIKGRGESLLNNTAASTSSRTVNPPRANPQGYAVEVDVISPTDARVVLYPRECRSGSPDVDIPFPEGYGWRIDIPRLLAESAEMREGGRNLTLYKYMKSTGWRVYDRGAWSGFSGENGNGAILYKMCVPVRTNDNRSVIVHFKRNL